MRELTCAESYAAMSDGDREQPLPGRLNTTDAPKRLLLEIVAGGEILQRIERRAFAPMMSVLHRGLMLAGSGRDIEYRHIVGAVSSLGHIYHDPVEYWRWQIGPASETADNLARFVWWRILYEMKQDESADVAGVPITFVKLWRALSGELRQKAGGWGALHRSPPYPQQPR